MFVPAPPPSPFPKERPSQQQKSVRFKAAHGGRKLAIPLAGARMGLTVSQIAMATATGYVVDSVVFPFSAIVMETKGRKCAGKEAPKLRRLGWPPASS